MLNTWLKEDVWFFESFQKGKNKLKQFWEKSEGETKKERKTVTAKRF